MANNAISFSSFTLLLVLLLLFQPALAYSKDKNSSSFEFLQHLQGYRKGYKVKDIHKLMMYLKKFGYLRHSNNRIHAAHDDEFDEQLVSAIKTYQLNFHLNPTGILDAETVSKMMMPRCGVADIINGTSRMRSGKKMHHTSGSKSIHKVSHYSFFKGYPRWPANKYHLTYGFKPWTPTAAISPVARAFETWASYSHFKFSMIEDYTYADLKISFERGDHRDGVPFDGPYGVIAHSFAPTDGRFHFDADERWAAGVGPGYFDLETTALHEIGHLLGLGHSSLENAIMYPMVPVGESKGLSWDDIQGIRVLYNYR
ncbi:hypothetical protein PTKIN_Ptkin08bG0043100 [Pterospermum kingtungense]